MNQPFEELQAMSFPATIPAPEMYDVFQQENQMWNAGQLINPSTLHHHPQVNHHDVYNMMNPLSPSSLPPLPSNLNDQHNYDQNQPLIMMTDVPDPDYDYDYDYNDIEQDQPLVSMIMISDQKPRLRWNSQLHKQFIDAVHELGGPMKATPKALLELMNVPYITRAQLKSHLQKFRMKSKRVDGGNYNIEEKAPKSYVDEMLNYSPRISTDQEVLLSLIQDKEAWKKPWQPQPPPPPPPQPQPQPQPQYYNHLQPPQYFNHLQPPPQHYNVLESSDPHSTNEILGTANVDTGGSTSVANFPALQSSFGDYGTSAMNGYNNSLVGGSVTGDGGNGVIFYGNFYGP